MRVVPFLLFGLVFSLAASVRADEQELAHLKRLQADNEQRAGQFKKYAADVLNDLDALKKQDPRVAAARLRKVLVMLDGELDPRKFKEENAKLQAALDEVLSSDQFNVPAGYLEKVVRRTVPENSWPGLIVFPESKVYHEVKVHFVTSKRVTCTIDGATVTYPSRQVPMIQLEFGVFLYYYDLDTYQFFSNAEFTRLVNESAHARAATGSRPTFSAAPNYTPRYATRTARSLRSARLEDRLSSFLAGIVEFVEPVLPEIMGATTAHIGATQFGRDTFLGKQMVTARNRLTEQALAKRFPGLGPAATRIAAHTISHFLDKRTLQESADLGVREVLMEYMYEVDASLTEYERRLIADSVLPELRAQWTLFP